MVGVNRPTQRRKQLRDDLEKRAKWFIVHQGEAPKLIYVCDSSHRKETIWDVYRELSATYQSQLELNV